MLLLWAHVVVLPVIAVLRHQTWRHALVEGAAVAVLALGAQAGRLGRTGRSSLATLGLMTSSAVLVHLFEGVIEVHFHFFVMVAVVALYQTWRPFLLALAFVILHHSVLGALASHAVYNHPSAQARPWLWAAVHGGFILAESVACIVYWRISEDALDGERAARVGLAKAHRDLSEAQGLARIGSWEWDLRSGAVTWSDQMFVLTGMDRDTFTPSVDSFLALVHPDDKARVADLLAAATERHAHLDYECRLVLPDGRIRHVHALGEFDSGADGTLVRMFGTCHDVTERRRLQEEIEHLAVHDALTGLANRRLFLDRLDHALAVQARSGRRCAVLFLDLDDFKAVNDTFGHSAGDELLAEVARRITALTRASDTVARLGGDEFALLCEDIDLEQARRLAERLEAALRRPLALHGAQISPRASIGIAMGELAVSRDDMMRSADAAMYAAKASGKDSHRVFPAGV